MPAGAVVRARIEETVKDEATAVLAQFGLTVSESIRVMLTLIARDKALPFDLRIPNAQTVAAVEEADEIRKSRKARFSNAEEVMNALDASE